MPLISLVLAAVVTTQAEVPRVKPADLHAMLGEGKAVAVDVRGSVPYKLGHIAGAVWIPLGRVEQRAGELPEEKLIVTYCTCHAEETSLEGAMLLSRHGFRVAVLEGGYPAWKSGGFPVEVSESVLAVEPRAGGSGGRLAPPSAVSCPRDELTSYAGAVKEYRRRRDETVLVIETSAGTTEKITLRHKGSDDASQFYLVESNPFTAADWNRIERRKGDLRSPVSAIAWVCSSGVTIVDWRPGVSFSGGE